ncbi:hypothetical protein [Chryseobacterium chendengshani]|uniref:hypothetical protein n=1 Tax=Chryseobacterium sp. LJ756 TaxID=2864113 RepID=UPI001C6404E6|nr:hypothetical protein [Chryseobacterium sp. LJ756]MBW7675812.1 hypothetical protein [Chryseobacterium sp. LJ756]
MENLQGGTNRQCLIDGALTAGAMIVGGIAGGLWGAAGGLLGGLYAGNSNGCFDK